MSRTKLKPREPATANLPLPLVVAICAGWFVLALMFFLLFSTPLPGSDQRALWYVVGTYVFELLGFLAASLLCFRNYQSPQIISGRNVWLCFALGTLFYFVGDLIFGWYELVLNKEPIVSPGDFCYFATYGLLGTGMGLAVTSRRLNLDLVQWVVVGIVGLVGAVVSLGVTYYAAAEPEAQSDLLAQIVTAAYPLGDTLLLIMATTLLLAFWGGRFAEAWRLIAGGALALYVGDVGFAYASSVLENYQSGGLIEVFWVLFPVLFAIGAAVEYDVSGRSRRSGRKR